MMIEMFVRRRGGEEGWKLEIELGICIKRSRSLGEFANGVSFLLGMELGHRWRTREIGGKW